MPDDIPVLGPVTVTFSPAGAAEVAMVLQHVLHNIPENPRPDQAARAHTLGEAAIVLSNGLVAAMKAAGLSDELIARASGRIMLAAPEANAAQLTIAPEPPPDGSEIMAPMPSGETQDEPAPDWAADATEDPTPDAPVDFPSPGGPPNAA